MNAKTMIELEKPISFIIFFKTDFMGGSQGHVKEQILIKGYLVWGFPSGTVPFDMFLPQIHKPYLIMRKY